MISKYSVKRPYTVLVAVVLVIVLGAVSLSKMTTDLLPDMSFQYALVVTTDMGASPEQVESDVTAPIESAMATTSNIKNISSVSYNSYSVVTLEYEQNANMDSVYNACTMSRILSYTCVWICVPTVSLIFSIAFWVCS